MRDLPSGFIHGCVLATRRSSRISLIFGALALFAAGAALFIVPPGNARADGSPAHNPASGDLSAPCAGCHRIHTATGANLLKQTDINQLCRTCHGASGTGSDLNVDLGKTNGGPAKALRAGGFESAMLDVSDIEPGRIQPLSAPAPVTSKHVLGAAGTMWGNGAAGSGPGVTLSTLTCVNCHDPHGGSNAGGPTYRILRVRPTGSGATTDAVVTDETANVARNYGTTNYFEPMLELTGWAAGRGMAAWCAQCHTRYLANTSTVNARSGDSIFAFQHPAGELVYSNGFLTCTKCHTAHGTNSTTSAANFTQSVAYPDGSLAPSAGASRLLKMSDRAICRKCHADK